MTLSYYFAVLNQEEELIGFFGYEPEETVLEIGLGLRPNLTGKGLGEAFVRAGLHFGRTQFQPHTFRLAVAAFNQRAIRLYRRLGFKTDNIEKIFTNGDFHEFLLMSQPSA